MKELMDVAMSLGGTLALMLFVMPWIAGGVKPMLEALGLEFATATVDGSAGSYLAAYGEAADA